MTAKPSVFPSMGRTLCQRLQQAPGGDPVATPEQMPPGAQSVQNGRKRPLLISRFQGRRCWQPGFAAPARPPQTALITPFEIGRQIAHAESQPDADY